MVLTGAGISTNAGLPDYRGQGRSRRASIDFETFRKSESFRRDYWRQAIAGWHELAAAAPTKSHLVLARLQKSGRCLGVVTQNVDGLHSAAGSEGVIELHGNESQVRCLECHKTLDRAQFEKKLYEMNPTLGQGDGNLDSLPICDCGGQWRPAITMFGEEVDRDVYQQAQALLARSHGLLVLGSSLRVNTGYQILRSALAMSIPTVLINLGPSEGVGVADVSIVSDVDLGMERLFGE